MVSELRKRTAHWVPAGYCVALSLITLCGVYWSVRVGGPDWGWAIPFLCFLPVCFFHVGATTSAMQREITELRKQVAELQRGNGREPPTVS